MRFTDIIPYYTYFLALQKCNHNSEYTIHGLWIDYNIGGYPEYCNKTDKFNLNEIKEFEPELNKLWYSCYGKSETFWEHEWVKHGTCFHPKMNLKEYFNKTLNLYYNKKEYIKKCTKKDCLIEIDFIEL